MNNARPCNVPVHLRCEALMLDSYLRPTNWRCRRYASIELNDAAGKKKTLCGKHAEMLALAVSLKTGQAKELPKAAKSQRGPVRFVGEDEV